MGGRTGAGGGEIVTEITLRCSIQSVVYPYPYQHKVIYTICFFLSKIIHAGLELFGLSWSH